MSPGITEPRGFVLNIHLGTLLRFVVLVTIITTCKQADKSPNVLIQNSSPHQVARLHTCHTGTRWLNGCCFKTEIHTVTVLVFNRHFFKYYIAKDIFFQKLFLVPPGLSRWSKCPTVRIKLDFQTHFRFNNYHPQSSLHHCTQWADEVITRAFVFSHRWSQLNSRHMRKRLTFIFSFRFISSHG